MFGLPSHIHVFCWSPYPCICICVAERGGITRINGTNAVHLEAIDHGTVQPSYTNVSIFPRTTNWSSIIKGLYHKKWELRGTPFFTSLQSPSSFLLIIRIVPSFAWTSFPSRYCLSKFTAPPLADSCFKNEVLFEDNLCWYLQGRANNFFAKNTKNLLFVTRNKIIYGWM